MSNFSKKSLLIKLVLKKNNKLLKLVRNLELLKLKLIIVEIKKKLNFYLEIKFKAKIYFKTL